MSVTIEHWVIKHLRSSNVLCYDVLQVINEAIYENTGWTVINKSKIIEAQLRKVKAFNENENQDYDCQYPDYVPTNQVYSNDRKYREILSSYTFALEVHIKDVFRCCGTYNYIDKDGNKKKRKANLYAYDGRYRAHPYEKRFYEDEIANINRNLNELNHFMNCGDCLVGYGAPEYCEFHLEKKKLSELALRCLTDELDTCN